MSQPRRLRPIQMSRHRSSRPILRLALPRRMTRFRRRVEQDQADAWRRYHRRDRTSSKPADLRGTSSATANRSSTRSSQRISASCPDNAVSEALPASPASRSTAKRRRSEPRPRPRLRRELRRPLTTVARFSLPERRRRVQDFPAGGIAAIEGITSQRRTWSRRASPAWSTCVRAARSTSGIEVAGADRAGPSKPIAI